MTRSGAAGASFSHSKPEQDFFPWRVKIKRFPISHTFQDCKRSWRWIGPGSATQHLSHIADDWGDIKMPGITPSTKQSLTFRYHLNPRNLRFYLSTLKKTIHLIFCVFKWKSLSDRQLGRARGKSVWKEMDLDSNYLRQTFLVTSQIDSKWSSDYHPSEAVRAWKQSNAIRSCPA